MEMDRLIVALDVFSFDEMTEIVDSVGETVSCYKIGHQLFTSEGPKVIEYLRKREKKVLLDLKLHEISNSVAQAIRSAAKHGVNSITVHASGGRGMLEAAVLAASEFPDMQILALTVVTGLDDADLKELGINSNVTDQVVRLAELALSSGCQGVIASANEVALLRENLGSEFLIITPGIRPAGVDVNDQVRVNTPKQSIVSGASAIIVGRPITQSKNPALVVAQITNEIGAIDT